MIRAIVISVAAAMIIAPVAEAQQRASARPAQQANAIQTSLCRVEAVAAARGGVAFVCVEGGSNRTLIASDGGARPGGVSAMMTWMIDARDNSASNRGGATVRHQAPSAAAQRICDDLALPGPTNRQPRPCRELVAAYH